MTPSRYFRDLSLSSKLFIPTLGLLILTGVAVAALVVRDSASRAQAAFDSDLVRRELAARTAFLDAEFSVLESVRFGANLAGVPEAVQRGDKAAVANLAASVPALKERLTLVVLTDAAGSALVTFTRSGGTLTVSSGESWSSVGVVSEVKAGVTDSSGDKRSGIATTSGGPMLVAAAPIRAGERLVGVSLSGERLEDVLADAASRAQAPVGFYDLGRQRVASSQGFKPPAPGSLMHTGAERVTQGGIGYIVSPLQVHRHNAGSLVIGLETQGAFAEARRTSLRIGLALALALAAGFAFRRVITNYVLREVRALVDANRRLGRGDLGSRADVRSRDEIGELAEGFNQMAEQLEAGYQLLEERVAQRTEELQRTSDDLARATQTRTATFADLAHELRTPLSAIIGFADLLLDPDFDRTTKAGKSDGTAVIQHIKDAGKNMLAMINEILDVAKFERREIPLERRPLDVASVVDDIRRTLDALARQAELTLTFDVAADTEHVDADPLRLRQILLNLTSNAIKYTKPGGRVGIVAGNRDGGVVAVSVSDSGVGIPDEAAPHIFEPFFQVAGTKAQGGQASTGLGLALTKRLVDAHGGQITFESEPGQGTTFTFTLPVARVGSRSGPGRPRTRARARAR